MSVRTRYAPSPTGLPHLGVLRTAIYAYLTAKHAGGTFILRLEDTDQSRSVEGSDSYIAEALNWLGIPPDEGVYLDEADGVLKERGGHGPYVQSKRLDIYKQYADQLLESGAAYRCFCTPERLAALREEQEKNHQAPRYDRLCRSLSREESERRASAGEKHVIRQAMPDNETVVFTDLIRGEISFNSSDLDDQVLLKSDGFPTYQLANVIDDHLMEITHVHRGEEWIPSTPKNLLLYKAFGWQPPLYAHLPVILGPDRKHKLSKRDGAEPILSYRERGYLPQAMVNFLAFIGWSPGTEEEFFTMDELVSKFEIERVHKAAGVFDPMRLDYVNGWYIRQLPVGEVWDQMRPFIVEAGLLAGSGPFQFTSELAIQTPVPEYLLKVAFAVQQRLKHFDESVEASWFFFKRPPADDALRELIVPKKGSLEMTMPILREVVEVLEAHPENGWHHDALEELLRGFIARKELKAMDVLWPVRAALSGVAGSPGAFEMLEALGREESLVRLKAVVG